MLEKIKVQIGNEEYLELEGVKIKQVYTHSSGEFGMRFKNRKWID